MLLLSLVTLLAVPYVFGQGVTVVAKIPFEFTAAGKVLPAGEYRFVAESGAAPVRVSPVGKGDSVLVPIITRIGGAIHTSHQDAHVVFDVVGNSHILSEIWGRTDDGLLLASTKEKHQHETVTVP